MDTFYAVSFARQSLIIFSYSKVKIVISAGWANYRKTSEVSPVDPFRSSHPEVLCKKGSAYNSNKKETLAHEVSSELCEVFKNYFFKRIPPDDFFCTFRRRFRLNFSLNLFEFKAKYAK